MALTAKEQSLLNVAKAAMPPWFTDDAREMEDLGGIAKQMGKVIEISEHWLGDDTGVLGQAYIDRAVGATATEPDWLNQHARDRDTSRIGGETDAALRKRIKQLGDVVTRTALLAAARQVLDDDGLSAVAVDMTEMQRDAIYLSPTAQVFWVQATGTGGTFAGPASGTMTFTPTVKFPFPPYQQSTAVMGDPEATGGSIKVKSGRIKTFQIVVSGASSGGNNGTFLTTGLSGNGVKYANGSGVAGADAGVTWALRRREYNAVTIDGWAHSFFDRGERLTRARNGTSVMTVGFISNTTQRARIKATLEEMLRQKGPGGIAEVVEMRST